MPTFNPEARSRGLIAAMKEVSIVTTWIILAAAAIGAAGLWYSWKRRRGIK
jgi:LPXTG-motif cell wall-anchored protein